MFFTSLNHNLVPIPVLLLKWITHYMARCVWDAYCKQDIVKISKVNENMKGMCYLWNVKFSQRLCHPVFKILTDRHSNKQRRDRQEMEKDRGGIILGGILALDQPSITNALPADCWVWVYSRVVLLAGWSSLHNGLFSTSPALDWANGPPWFMQDDAAGLTMWCFTPVAGWDTDLFQPLLLYTAGFWERDLAEVGCVLCAVHGGYA